MEQATPENRCLRVLVVDDNRDAADTLLALLRLWGYDAQTAYDGRRGLEAARNFQPHCLFLDIDMPEMDGYDLARQLRGDPGLGGAKLVALTAYAGQDHLRRAQEAGFDYHFTKPADPEAVEGLLKMLNQIMELAGRTERLALENVGLAQETRELIGQAKDELQEVKQEIREVKEEIQEVKEELREVKEVMRKEEPER